eukprot:1353499-Amorphochlora_amoeboformis.AAC.1
MDPKPGSLSPSHRDLWIQRGPDRERNHMVSHRRPRQFHPGRSIYHLGTIISKYPLDLEVGLGLQLGNSMKKIAINVKLKCSK